MIEEDEQFEESKVGSNDGTQIKCNLTDISAAFHKLAELSVVEFTPREPCLSPPKTLRKNSDELEELNDIMNTHKQF